MTRPAVHLASGRTLGASDPRQEAPVDLRLVPPALAAWIAAALAVGAPGRWTAIGVGALAVAGALLLGAAVAASGATSTGAWRLRTWWLRTGRGCPGAGRSRAEGGPGPGARWRVNATAGAGVLLCAAAGAASAGLHAADVRRGPLPELAGEHARVTAEVTVTSDPRPVRPRVSGDHMAPDAVVLEAEATRVERPGRGEAVGGTRTPVLVIVAPGSPGDTAKWRGLLPSTRLRVTARAVPPRDEGDPLAAVLQVSGARPPVVTGGPTSVQRTAGALRAGLRRAAEGLAPDARALLPGLVVGDTSGIPPDLRAAFEATDLSHLTAVSGSNLTVVLLLLIGPPGAALRAERGGLAPRLGIPLRATAVLGGGLTLAFVVVCRPDPSVLRAAACGAVALLAIATGRRRSLLPALAAAVLGLVLYDPWLARSYGFLLSVLATGALLTVAPRWSAALRRCGVPARAAEALGAAMAAQVVCAPVVVVFTARVGLVAVPCNLLAELAVAPATVLGFAALAAAPLAMPVAEVLARCAGWPAGWIASVARAGAALPGAEIGWVGGWWGAALLAGATLLVLLLLVARGPRRRPWVVAGCAVLLMLAVVRPAPLPRVLTGWPPPGWVFAMCDVGQGDATVLAAGDGTAVVVDAGPDPAAADRCLRELGVDRVALLLLTHFHADHVAGLPGVLRGRSVGVIEVTPFEEPPGQVEFVRRAAAGARVPVVRAGAGEVRRTGRLAWEVLWPGAFGAEGPNDASVALLVRVVDGPVLLLLGDLEPRAQEGLLRAYPGLPAVDVLKVAHHGSAHQEPELLRRVRPRLALVSAGRDNPYGHPSPRTLGALEAGGAVVLRTDRDGTIAVTGKGGRGGDLRAVPEP
ncbi:ComEC/Rec2 family competence protein [Streptomyces sp. NPDC001941]|uniref:ComEC/Rec2 family competence protein n=1 Tax=Streptomyces sp. NPDC001941 TaxID=3154659 RepID=UPI00332D77BB